MTWFFSYLGANWSLILVVILVVAALIALTVLAHNWKAAVIAVAILAAAFAYQWIDKSAYARAVAEEAQRTIKIKDDQIAALELRVETVNAANELSAMQASSDFIELSKLKATANDTPANATVALKRDAVERVRGFRRSAASGGAAGSKGGVATGAGRHPKLLPIWKWGRPAAGS